MTATQIKVAIVGVTGYAGMELLRLLHAHPYVQVVSVHQTTATHETLNQTFPHLQSLYKMTPTPVDPVHIMQNADLVFFATSSGVTKTLAAPFMAQHFPVIDLSGDFRLNAKDYAQWYHQPAAPQALLDQASYSLADFYTNDKSYIANPGCYATATLLALAPLAQSQLLDANSIVIDARSGLSGAGKSLTTASHFVTVNENMMMYKVNQHQHLPEIMQQLQRWQPSLAHIQFTTSLLPINRGIFVSAYAKLKQPLTPAAIHALYHQTYADKPFVRLMPLDTLPDIKQVVGTNFTDIGLTYNPITHYLTIVSVLDNMIKGAAGQAIQNMNHLYDFEETTGLNLIAQYA